MTPKELVFWLKGFLEGMAYCDNTEDISELLTRILKDIDYDCY